MAKFRPLQNGKIKRFNDRYSGHVPDSWEETMMHAEGFDELDESRRQQRRRNRRELEEQLEDLENLGYLDN
jgi:hypothetical protein